MDSLISAALPAPAKDALAPIVRRLALVFGLSVTLLLPAGYFYLTYANLKEHIGTVAQVKAETVNRLANASPDMWTNQLQFMEDLLQMHPESLASDLTPVLDAAGTELLSLGEVPDAPVLVRSSAIYDSGRVIGRVAITHSYRGLLFGALGAALLGLLLGGLAYAAVYLLPLRALRRVSAELVRESAALSASASRYRALAESTSDAIITANEAGNIVGWNPAARKLFGYSEAEAVGQPLALVMPDQYRAGHLAGMQRIQTGGERHVIGRSVEVEGLTKGGRVFPLELALSEWETPQGRFFAGIIHDITERRQAQLALTRQKDLYDMLSQTNKAIVHLTDRDALFGTACRIAVEHGRFRFAWIGLVDKDDPRQKLVARYGEDAGYIDQLNRTGDGESDMRRGLTGRTLLSGSYAISNDFLGDPAMAPWHEAAQRAGVRASAKFPIRQGGVVFGAINLYAGEPGFFTEDLVATLDEMAHDVSFALDNYARETARRTSVAALREGEERYRKMFRANPHPMWVYDLETLRFLEVNDAAISHYGWSRAEFLAMSIADIRPPADVPRLTENIAHVSEGKVDAAGVWTHRKKNGALIAVEITSHILDFEGRRAEIVLVNDITERQQSEQALRAAEEQFRGLVEQSITGIYIIQDGKFAYANPRYAEILGYDSVSELIG
ncbi:MAG: PAS domain S-box protein, partial [Burkholderiales bacterium]|nr:PAS domain S-box protein [Burkholderiales bacterium]